MTEHQPPSCATGANAAPADEILTHDAAAELAAHLLSAPPTSITPVSGGRNSRVFRVVSADGRTLALKVYHREPTAQRDRLAVEFQALEFLWQHGVRAIPQPIARDTARNAALYAFIAGAEASTEQLTAHDIEQALAFVGQLKQLAALPAALVLPRAAEACFTTSELFATLHRRQQRLSQVDDAPELQAFLTDELLPAQTLWLSALQQADVGSRELPVTRRWLSPSDFGFHNARRQGDGNWVFFDFEYFGWDDPAKLMADFRLHPALPVPLALREQFVAGVLDICGTDDELAARYRRLYPCFALKWCYILLNEFLPSDLSRRQFAAGTQLARDAARAVQLAKARQLLRTTREER